MPTEPPALDPARLTTSDASYFLSNIMRGLYTYNDKTGLVPEGARACEYKSALEIRCELARRFWSDGSSIVAEDYVRAFRRLVQPNSKSLSIELLKNLKNAIGIRKGQMPPDQLGIAALDSDHLRFEFEKPDSEFLYKLTYSVLVPVKQDVFPQQTDSHLTIVNGPYRVTQWQTGRRIRLEANPTFDDQSARRPPVEILILDDDETALNLYEQGELTLLRRLPTTYIPRYRERPDFMQIPVLRFDYVGFGSALKDDPEMRQALSLALDYDELAHLLDAAGRPGCAGLAKEFFTDLPCLRFDREKARTLLQTSRAKNGSQKPKPLLLTFSKLGGDDVKKAAEWFQAQWKKNLGLDVQLQQLEQSVQLHTLRTDPPPLFRKGLHPERPTCLATLEIFAKDGPDNFLKIEDPVLERDIAELATASTESTRKMVRSDGIRASLGERQACTKAVNRLLDQSRIIPLGQVHFTLLASPRFRGWSLNEMNQLDLSGLEVSP